MRVGQSVFLTGQANPPDVGTQQVENLVEGPCLSMPDSGMVGAGQSAAAMNAERGLVHAGADTAPQKRWSRGCRRANVSLWLSPWAWHWLLAPRKKKFRSSSRFRSSRATPASTSNLLARARRLSPNGPDPHSDQACAIKAAGSASSLSQFDAHAAALWAQAGFSLIALSGRDDKGQDKC